MRRQKIAWIAAVGAGAMVFAGITPAMADTVPETPVTADGLIAAVAAAGSTPTVFGMSGDQTVGGGFLSINEGQDITIDLHGGTLTIAPPPGYGQALATVGDLTIEGGNLVADGGIAVADGTMTVDGSLTATGTTGTDAVPSPAGDTIDAPQPAGGGGDGVYINRAHLIVTGSLTAIGGDGGGTGPDGYFVADQMMPPMPTGGNGGNGVEIVGTGTLSVGAVTTATGGNPGAMQKPVGAPPQPPFIPDSTGMIDFGPTAPGVGMRDVTSGVPVITGTPGTDTGTGWGWTGTEWVALPVQPRTIQFSTGGHGTAPIDQTVTDDGTITPPTPPTADGYAFDGWTTDPAGTTPYDFSTPVTSDVTLYAQWTQDTTSGGGSTSGDSTSGDDSSSAGDSTSGGGSPGTPRPVSPGIHPHTAPFTDVTTKTPFADAIDWMRTQGLTTGYADGTFRPTAPTTRDALVAFLYREANGGSTAAAAPDTAPFSDVATTDTFAGDIAWARQKGYVTGYRDGTFRPDDTITREATIAILYRVEHHGQDAAAPDTAPFPDVPTTAQFAGDIAWAKTAKISTGYGDGTFHPSAHITREAVAAFLYRTSLK